MSDQSSIAIVGSEGTIFLNTQHHGDSVLPAIANNISSQTREEGVVATHIFMDLAEPQIRERISRVSSVVKIESFLIQPDHPVPYIQPALNKAWMVDTDGVTGTIAVTLDEFSIMAGTATTLRELYGELVKIGEVPE